MKYVVTWLTDAIVTLEGHAMGRLAAAIVLSEAEEAELKRWRRRRNTATGLHMHAGIVLVCSSRSFTRVCDVDVTSASRI